MLALKKVKYKKQHCLPVTFAAAAAAAWRARRRAVFQGFLRIRTKHSF